MLHAVHPKSCEGTTSPERSCSPGMWVALTTCPPCHSDSHRLRDRADIPQLVAALWLGLRLAGDVHVDDDREEPVVELLVEVLHGDGRVGAEDRCECKQHLVARTGGQAISGDADAPMRGRDGSGELGGRETGNTDRQQQQQQFTKSLTRNIWPTG